MLVPRLEDIVLSVSIRQQWFQSRLPALVANILITTTCKESREFSDCIADVIEKYKRVMAQCPLPGYLQQRWAVVFNGVAREALDFLRELKGASSPYSSIGGSLANIIVFSQNCGVDTTKTILAALEHKEAAIMFQNNFMLNHFVMKDDLMRLLLKLEAQIEKRVTYRSEKIITRERQNLQNAHRALANYKDIQEVLQEAVTNTHKNLTPDACLGILRNLSNSMHYKLLEYWMEMCCHSDQDMVELAIEIFNYYNNRGYFIVPPKVTMLFLEYLGTAKFIQATNEAPERIFWSLLDSWHSRRLCVGVFPLLLPHLDADACGRLLNELAAHLDKDLQVDPILRHIWNDVPKSLKDNLHNKIAQMIGRHNFHPTLLQLLKDYENNSVKTNSMLMLSLEICLDHNKLAKQDLDILKQRLRDLKNMFGEKRDFYLEHLQLKYLLIEKIKPIVLIEIYHSLVSLSRAGASATTTSMAQDVDFIERFLSKHWGDSKILGFFHCLFDGDEQRAAAYLLGIEEQVLLPLLAKKLSRGSVRFAVGCLQALRHPHGAALAAALDSASVRTHTISRMLNSAANTRFTFSRANWHIFLSDPVAMESLLLSAEGTKLILNIVTKQIKGLSTTFDEYHLNILEQYKNIIVRLLTPTRLCAKVEAFLAEWGHPNAKEAGGDSLDRLLTDFRYRSLRALLAGAARAGAGAAGGSGGAGWGQAALPLPMPRLQSGRVLLTPTANSGTMMTATEVSIALAELVDLKVPVIL